LPLTGDPLPAVSQRRRLQRPDARPAPRLRLLAARRRLRPQVRHGTHGPRPDPNHPAIPTRAARSRPQTSTPSPEPRRAANGPARRQSA